MSCSRELCGVRVIPAVDVAVVRVKAARRCDGWAGWPVRLWVYGGSTRGVPVGVVLSAAGRFEVGYVTEDGAEHRVRLDEAWLVPLERALPVRASGPGRGSGI